MFSRFNVDCGAASGLYGAAEGAFGSSAAGSGGRSLAGEYLSHLADVDLIINFFSIVGDSDAGECPAPSAGGDCAGAVSNCWSPGQRDTGAFKMSS